MGVNPSKIIFANPAKPASHLRYSSSVGVDIMTVDNESELHKIKYLHPTAKVNYYTIIVERVSFTTSRIFEFYFQLFILLQNHRTLSN